MTTSIDVTSSSQEEPKARMLTAGEVDTIMWFCIHCCGVSTWGQFAQLIMRCERESETLELIKHWHACQHGAERDYARVRAVQIKVYPLIEEYKYVRN